MKPSYIGIGAQECASAWVHHILQDHPQAFVSTPTDLNFFSHNYVHGLPWYEKYFAKGRELKARGEISPSYFYDLSAPMRAYKYNSNFKIIVTLRDPIERAYSDHLNEVHSGNYTGEDLSFEAGLASNPMYVEQSCYATHIMRWLQLFPREQILILLQEDIYAGWAEQAQRVYNFLGINATHKSDYLQFASQNPEPKSAQIDSILKKLGSLGRKTGMENLVTAVKNNSFVSAVRQANTAEGRHIVPPMRPETWAFLQAELLDEVLELADLLSRASLPWPSWSIKKPPIAISRESRQALAS
ncbi:MAG: sulfotransferase domain-containing protein [Gammaproteobacteria bacterium]